LDNVESRTGQQQTQSSLLSLIRHFIGSIWVVQRFSSLNTMLVNANLHMTCQVKILSFLNARLCISGKSWYGGHVYQNSTMLHCAPFARPDFWIRIHHCPNHSTKNKITTIQTNILISTEVQIPKFNVNSFIKSSEMAAQNRHTHRTS